MGDFLEEIFLLFFILKDEFLQKGYGIGSGISLFIATNICENIVWKCFCPTQGDYGRGPEFEGAVIALVHLLITRADKGKALREAFTRVHLPNMTNMVATVVIFLIVVYFQGFRVELALSHKKVRNFQQNYSVKLFYTSNTPIILQSALVSLVYFVSQMLFSALPSFFLIRMIGAWETSERGQKIPIGGLVYYISPLQSLSEIFSDPLHFIVYLVFVLATSALFSRLWIDLSGSGVKDVMQTLKQQQVSFPGHRDDSMQHHLNRYIPIAAAFGGMCIGLLTVVADFVGAIGSGTGILLAVTTIYQCYETLLKEGEESSMLMSLLS
jgi:protein transport protein SEC61 subunit alpha